MMNCGRRISPVVILALTVFGISAPAFVCGQTVEGFSEPVYSVDVASPEPGTIDAILVRQGQRVKAGEPLVQMDAETLSASLDLARAKARIRAKADSAAIELAVRQRRLENLNRLGRENSSSEEVARAAADVDLARTQVLAAEEEILQNQLEAKRIEIQLARRTIRSPIDGVVIRLHRQRGDFVTAAEPQLVTVVDLRQLRIILYPLSSHAEQIQRATHTMIRMERSGEPARAVVDFVSPVTSADSGTVRVELLLDNAAGRYRSGLRCWLAESPGDSPPSLSLGRNDLSVERTSEGTRQ